MNSVLLGDTLYLSDGEDILYSFILHSIYSFICNLIFNKFSNTLHDILHSNSLILDYKYLDFCMNVVELLHDVNVINNFFL